VSRGGSLHALPVLAVAGAMACAAASPRRVSAPAPADPNELYFCVVAQVNALGYRVRRYDRESQFIQAVSLRPQGRDANLDPLYNEVTVTVSHDTSGDTMHVTASDRRHGEAILKRCAAKR